ncbi:hypothetical protein PVAND_010208 [Polypedilum vanderplanki]|uniref:Uncharacterized protein n=1 Tax=Polypedilum vanderplanki TaxID=319348 RepID=A0A9J6CGJ1_POLVA|nr:hypothetical protein PVAND_010208 [Polypedilum vanderplanki]
MIQLAANVQATLYRNFLRTSSNKSFAINAYSIINRHKSTTNNRKQNNIQQTALKLDPSKKLECPQQTSSSTSTPPPSNNYKMIIAAAGGAIIGFGSFLYYQNQQDKDTKVSQSSSSTEFKKSIITRIPEDSKNIPKHVPYLLIGGGTASFAAFRAIKSNDARAKVLVISDELAMPYMRPPLSKEIWSDTDLGLEKARFKQWNGAERSIFYEPEDFYMPIEKLEESKNGGVSVIQGYTVTKLNVNEQKVLLDDGTEITYDKCLLATGSSPKTLRIFDSASPKIKEKIFTYKSVKDFELVKKQVEKSKNVAIVGNGFLGSELACALSHYGTLNDLKVVQLFPESGNMAKVLPKYLSEWATERIRDVGVNVLPNSQIVNVELFNGNQIKLILNNGNSIIADFVIQAIGSQPNTNLAEKAALEIDQKLGGFLVNAELEARSNLYVAGDVACFYDPHLGRRRVEHHDHAVVSGRLAGENMVGLRKPYKHQSMFWSDLGTAIGYEAIGLIDSSLETVGIFAQTNSNDNKNEIKIDGENKEAHSVESGNFKKENGTDNKSESYNKGILFYMKNDRIVGILLWNVFNRISIARKILSSEEKFDDLNEVAKLFDIFEQHHQQDKEDLEKEKGQLK